MMEINYLAFACSRLQSGPFEGRPHSHMRRGSTIHAGIKNEELDMQIVLTDVPPLISSV